MSATDLLLRETFADQAAMITMQPGTRARIDGLAHRYRARRVAVITGAAVAVAALAVAVPAALTPVEATLPHAPAAASGSFASWAPRGSLAADPAFAAAATAAWDAATPGHAPHADVGVLWAGAFETGRGAVLRGTNGEGNLRLAVVAGGTPSLKVIRDVPAPADLTHLSFSLFTDDEAHSIASYRDTLVVLTPPASGWIVEWAGGPDASYGLGTEVTEDGVAVIDISQSGPVGHPTIRLLDRSVVVYEGPIGTQS